MRFVVIWTLLECSRSNINLWRKYSKDNGQNYAGVKNSLTQHGIYTEFAELKKVQWPILWPFSFTIQWVWHFTTCRRTVKKKWESALHDSIKQRWRSVLNMEECEGGKYWTRSHSFIPFLIKTVGREINLLTFYQFANLYKTSYFDNFALILRTGPTHLDKCFSRRLWLRPALGSESTGLFVTYKQIKDTTTFDLLKPN